MFLSNPLNMVYIKTTKKSHNFESDSQIKMYVTNYTFMLNR